MGIELRYGKTSIHVTKLSQMMSYDPQDDYEMSMIVQFIFIFHQLEDCIDRMVDKGMMPPAIAQVTLGGLELVDRYLRSHLLVTDERRAEECLTKLVGYLNRRWCLNLQLRRIL